MNDLHCFLADNSNRGHIAGQNFTDLDRLTGTQRGLFCTAEKGIGDALDQHCEKDKSVKRISPELFLALGGKAPEAPAVLAPAAPAHDATGSRVASKPGVVMPGKETVEPEAIPTAEPLGSVEDVLKQSVAVAEEAPAPESPKPHAPAKAKHKNAHN